MSHQKVSDKQELVQDPSHFDEAGFYVVTKPTLPEGHRNGIPEVMKEDFTEPSHPLYGEVDEHGRNLPGWLEQITIRWATLTLVASITMMHTFVMPIHNTKNRCKKSLYMLCKSDKILTFFLKDDVTYVTHFIAFSFVKIF